MAGARRGGATGAFDMTFSRRPQANLELHMQSLLGYPQSRQQQQQQSVMSTSGIVASPSGAQSKPFGFGTAGFDQSYARRVDPKGNDDYFSSGSFGSGGGRESSYGRDDFTRASQPIQFQQARVPRDREDGRPAPVGNSVWSKRTPSPPSRMAVRSSGSDIWSRSGSQGVFDDARIMRGQGIQGISSLQMTPGSNIGQSADQQQMVMVVPQGNTGAGGLMGMVPVQATPNPFMMQQQPMQVIVGNLPGLNADAFGQQILTASTGQQFIMNQRHQQYDRSIVEGVDNRRLSARHGSDSQRRRSPGRSLISRDRRSDLSSSGRSTNRGSNSTSTSNSRSNDRKRAVLRDRHGASDETDRKRPRSSLPSSSSRSRDKKDRDGSKGKSSSDKHGSRRDSKSDGSKKESDDKTKKEKEDEIKKEGDDTTEKETETKSDETKEGESTKTDGEKEKQKKKSKYDEFPNSFLVCKICQKVMSDGASFESHLNGRAHVALVKILEERFQKRADLLMFESKLSEEEIGIEMERQRRAGKSGKSGKGSKNYCTMCDCNYTVNWGTHKVSMSHRILKEYLHPTCRHCNVNFVHRMDWVNHLYSLTHLRKLTELKEQGVDVEEQESSRQDELFAVNLEIGKDEHVTPVILLRSTDYKIPTKDDLKEMLKDEKGEIVVPEGEIDIPKEFDENQAYGEEAMTDIEGACCKVCRTYIGDRTEIEAHVKSKNHFGMYVSYLKKVVKYREHLKAEKEKAEKEAAEEVERAKKKAEEEEAAALKKAEEEAAALKKAEAEAENKKQDEETPMETEIDHNETEENGESEGNNETEENGESEGNTETEVLDANVKIETPEIEEDVAPVDDENEAVVDEEEPETEIPLEEEEEKEEESEVVAAPLPPPKPPIKGILKKTPSTTKPVAQPSRGGPRGGRGGTQVAVRGGGPRGGRGGRGVGRGAVRGNTGRGGK